MVQEYIEAFSRCYPMHRVELIPTHGKNGPGYWVYINNDRGERPLSDAELRSAIRDFERGKKH